jgi:hypothetical protein
LIPAALRCNIFPLQVAADNAGQLEQAEKLYEESARGLLEAIRSGEAEETAVTPHIQHYLKRAHEIKENLRTLAAVVDPEESIGSSTMVIDEGLVSQLISLGFSQSSACDALRCVLMQQPNILLPFS